MDALLDEGLIQQFDDIFTLKEGECMGACAMAPVVLVNNKRMCDYMSREKLDALVAELRDTPAVKA